MLKSHETGSIIISEIEDKDFMITETKDILDLMTIYNPRPWLSKTGTLLAWEIQL